MNVNCAIAIVYLTLVALKMGGKPKIFHMNC
jgi:hypothetical protein